MLELVRPRLQELAAGLNTQWPGLHFALLDEPGELRLGCSLTRSEYRPYLELVVRSQSDSDPNGAVASIASPNGDVDHRLECDANDIDVVLDVLSWVFVDTALRDVLATGAAVSPWHPAWVKLAVELKRLARVAKVHNAYVLDAWMHCWCSAHSYEHAPSDNLVHLTQLALSRLPKPLTRGGKLDEWLAGRAGHVYFRSFASIYVLALLSAQPFEDEAFHRQVDAALPTIEALTLALPSPEGPGTGAGEGALRG